MAAEPSLDEIEQELEFRRCRGSSPTDFDACFYFLTSGHWKIKHPERGAIRFDLRDAQWSTLATWIAERQSIALKARQIGFSTLVMGYAFWLVFFWDDKPIIALSKTERDAQKLLDKAKYGYDRLPKWMRKRGPRETAKTQSKLAFANGSVIESLPASDPARGDTAYLIVVDEWAHFENPEDAWSAIEPAFDIGGRVIALSTAKGAGNLFHEMVVGAMTGSNDFVFIFKSWRAVPERDDAWYAAKQRSMQSWQLHQEYPSTPEEAFIKSGNPAFDTDELSRFPTRDPKRGSLFRLPLESDEPDATSRHSEFRPAEDGPLAVWELPQVGTAYVVGADIAEGLEHGDYSVAHVINTRSGLVAAKWRGHIAADLFADVLWDLGWWYGCALIGPECNSIGLVTCTYLRDMEYPNIYWRTTYDERTLKEHRKIGWRTQINTKGMMITELAAALRQEDGESEVCLLDSETVAELRTFVRDPDGKMHGSPFDDQVISLAIANQMRKHAFSPEYATEQSDYMTFGWAMRELQRADLQDGRFVIGAHSSR